jgi:2'-5' RNA ligase
VSGCSWLVASSANVATRGLATFDPNFDERRIVIGAFGGHERSRLGRVQVEDNEATTSSLAQRVQAQVTNMGLGAQS